MRKQGNYIMSKKLHNPKSFAPAVYIPCWLIQVSIKLLTNGAKMLYGRLSQWASSDGTVYRSIPQLAEELGCSERSIEEYLRELKEVKLIGIFHPKAGGVNHYEFYNHDWMHEPIKDQLTYKEDKITPPHHSVVPTTSECGTPPHPSVDINIKEIKRNKKDIYIHSHPKTKIKKIQFGLEDILKNNPYQIPEKIICDWLTIRGKHIVTETAWNIINKELKKCVEEDIQPIEAFEIMVSRNWRSLKIDWLLSKEKISKKEQIRLRNIEFEQMAEKRKQKEIEDYKRLNKLPSNSFVEEISKMKELVNIMMPLKKINVSNRI